MFDSVSSCNQNDLFNSQMNNEETPTVQVETTTPTMRKAQTASFVQQNPSLFGKNVMIFESYNELDSTLNLIQEMDYKELRAWATDNNVTNDILESNIIYNEEWKKAEEYCNPTTPLPPYPGGTINLIDIPGTIPPAITLEEKAMERFIKTMQQKYPQYLQEYDSLGEHYVEPLGSINEKALTNEKHLFLINNEVHRFYTDGFVLCAMEDYHEIATFNSKEEVVQYINEKKNSQQKAPQVSVITNYSPKQFEAISGKYKITTDFIVGQMRSIWGTDLRHIDVSIRNYHKTKRGYWLGIACKTDYHLRAQTTCSANKQYTFNITHKGYTLSWHRRYYKTLNGSGNRLWLTSYVLNVSNQHGLTINKENSK